MDFNKFLQEQMQDDDFARQYYREATFYRLSDQFILLRKKRGMTQKDLAEKANTTQAVVSRLENVSVRPSLENVVRLAEALDAIVEVRLVPREEVRRMDEEKKIPEINIQSIIQEIDAASTSQKPIKEVQWFDLNASQWSISAKPTLQPVKKNKLQREFA